MGWRKIRNEVLNIFYSLQISTRAVIVKSIFRLVMDYATEKLRFDSRHGDKSVLFYIMTIPVWLPPSSLSSGYRWFFSLVNSSGIEMKFQLCLVPMLRMMELYLRSPINGVAFD
jgi:hypothetical protein